MANVLLDFLRQLAIGAAADEARATPQGKSIQDEYVKPVVTSLLDAIIPPAAASDASAIPQAQALPSVPVGNPVLPDDKLIPADAVMTPEQEQMVMNRIATEAPERPRVSGRTYLPDIQMDAPVSPERMNELDALIAAENKQTTQDFVRSFGPKIATRAQKLMSEAPEGSDPKGAAALASIEALAANADKAMDNEPMDLGAPVVGPKDVALGMYPNGKPAESTGGFFDSAGKFFSDLFGDEERMTRLALAFNSMRYQPDQGLATVLGKRLESLSEQRDRQKIAGSTGNATMKMLDQYPDIKAAYLSGQIELKDVLTYIQKMRRLELDEGAPAAFRSLEARAKAAGLTPGTKEYNQFMINGGQRKGLSLRVNKDGSIEMTEGGDLSSFTEAQSNALVFSQRMKASNLILDNVENVGSDLYNSIVNQIPVAGNYLISEEYQQYDQAKRDFINATLRKESGAAIAESEFANANRQYFPVPGDTPKVIAQKRANRQLAQKLIEKTVGQDVNEAVKEMNIKAGLESMYATPATEATKPPITPEQAKAELARRRGQ